MCSFLLYAQSKKQNYIKETLHLDTNGASIENVSYYDGLGNLSEIVSTASGTSDNVYTFKTYDSKGRESKNFYPTPIGSGLDFKDYYSFVSASCNYYNDEYAFKQNYYDDADHIVREDVAGNNWHAHSAHNEFSYETNTLSDKVIRYDADPIAKSYYPEGCLEKESAKDADGNEVVIFKDLDGNTILERRNRGILIMSMISWGSCVISCLPNIKKKRIWLLMPISMIMTNAEISFVKHYQVLNTLSIGMTRRDFLLMNKMLC